MTHEMLIKPRDFQDILESTVDLYLILNTKFEIVAVSDAYLKATMVKRDDILGKNILEIFPNNPNNPNRGERNLRRSLEWVLKNKTTDTMEMQRYDIRRPIEQGGEYEIRYWSPTNSPVLGKNHVVKYIIHRVEDVTDYFKLQETQQKDKVTTKELRLHISVMELELLKRAKELREKNERLLSANKELAKNKKQLIEKNKHLKASNEKFQHLVQGTKDYAIFTLDPDGYILDWNRGAEVIQGYKAKEIIGQHFSRFYTPEDIARHHPDNELKIARETGRYEEQGWRIRKTGERFWANVIITALHDDKGHLIGFSKITRDLTEQKKTEMLKNEFISMVSHELRTPLTSIRGSLGLVLGNVVGDVPRKIKDLLDIADKNCERLVRLINDILDIEKIEADSMKFNKTDFGLSQLIVEALEANRMYAEQFGVLLEFIRPKHEVTIHADSDRIMQVMTNLISNGIKFSPRGKRVTISMKTYDSSVRVSVKDQGHGIPKEFQSRIFQKFEQAASSLTRTRGGTGLGLSISKAIIEKSEGQINFITDPHQGTEFYFDLPIVKNVGKNPIKKQFMQPAFLICEPDKNSATVLQKILKENDFTRVYIANTAKEAKDILKEKHIDAIIMDLILPDQDGISLINEIRSLQKTRHIPIIAVSIKAGKGKQVTNGHAFTVLEWLTKPFRSDQLIHAIQLVKKEMTSNVPRILHIEDNDDLIKVVQNLLHDQADLISVTNLRHARQIMQEQDFDLVILDLMLPDGSGVNLLPELSQRKIPVIIFSAYELPKNYVNDVAEILLKGSISNEQIIETIRSVIKH